MPQIKFDYVVSFSSEDPSSPASNLLSKDIVNKKWVGQEKGVSSNSVVLQLEKSCQITSMHIGNHHSGFIEVLAGRSEASDQQYEVLLIASSFMTPSDSRNSVNISKVRTFTLEDLATPAKDKKWDRIKIVCTQPYNRHVQYGLSFFNIYSSDSNLSSTSKVSPTKQTSLLGTFKLRNDSDDEAESSFKPGELFARLKKNTTLSTDAQIRNASSPHNMTQDSSSLLVKTQRPVVNTEVPVNIKKTNEISPLSRKRDKLMYVDEDDEPNEKIDSIIKKDKEEKIKNSEVKKAEIKAESTSSKTKEIVKNKVPDKKVPKEISKNIASTSQSQSSTDISIPSTSRNINNSSSQENASNLKRKITPVQIVPDKKPRVDDQNKQTTPNMIRGPDCFKNIVFVISGYANPKRSKIRDIAISLGAKYRPDWGANCTHLICAFPNTPKHEQVLRTSRSAVVVTGEWIEECGKEKARLPWEWFATDPRKRIVRPPDNIDANNSPNSIENDDSKKKYYQNFLNDPATDDEDTDDEIERIIKKQSDSEKLKLEQAKKLSLMPTLTVEDSDITDIEDENDGAVSEQKYIPNLEAKTENGDSHKDLNGSSNIKTEIDPFEADTDSDSEIKNKVYIKTESHDLPDHFSGIKFYVDTNLENEAYNVNKLKRYLMAFNGELVDSWPDPRVDVAITIEKFVGNLRPDKGKNCQFLRPEWIWKCKDENMLYEFGEYVIY